jgi:hypothetical protein
MRIEENEFDRDIVPNPNDLAEDWLRQPILMRKYTKAAAEASLTANEAKLKEKVRKVELDKAKAAVEKEIREHPTDYMPGKPTEKTVAAHILLHPTVAKAQEDYFDATEDLNKALYHLALLDGGIKSLDDKRRALESFVELERHGWFSAPRERETSRISNVQRKRLDKNRQTQ